MKRRKFSAEFKAKIVLEVIRGEKELNEIASDYEIAPNQIRNWKNEFLKNAAAAFDDNYTEDLKTQIQEKERESEALYKKVGQLTTQVDWLKKNLRKCLDLNGKVSLLRDQKGNKDLPLRTVAELLGISRKSIYRKPRQPDEQEIKAKRLIEELHTANPAWGSRQLSKQFKKNGILIGRLMTRKYINEMGITAIYPKPNLSKAAKGHKIYPYLLRNAVINQPNQAWSIDITYIRQNHGFVYLTAIIDWYSRCIVGWEIDDSLSTVMVLRALDKALIEFHGISSLDYRTPGSLYYPLLLGLTA